MSLSPTISPISSMTSTPRPVIIDSPGRLADTMDPDNDDYENDDYENNDNDDNDDNDDNYENDDEFDKELYREALARGDADAGDTESILPIAAAGTTMIEIVHYPAKGITAWLAHLHRNQQRSSILDKLRSLLF